MNVARAAAACAVVLVAAGPARAQIVSDPGAPAAPARPNRELYGGSGATASHSLTANATIGVAGYQILTGASSAASPSGSRESWAGQLTGALNYSLSLRRFTLSAQAGSAGAYYPDLLDRDLIQTRNAQVNGTVRLGRQTSLAGSHWIGYQPVYFLTTLSNLGDQVADAATLVNAGDGAGTERYVHRTTSLSLSHRFSRRVNSWLNANYSQSESDRIELQTKSAVAGGGLNVSFTRNLALRLGYQYLDTRYGMTAESDSANRRGHNIDAGLDYARALSLSRHTSFTFGTGGTVLVDRTNTRRYVVTGRAALTHQLGRTWSSSVSFTRNAGFVEAFQDPVVSETVSASLFGLLSRRLQFTARGNASLSNVGFVETNNGFVRVEGSAGIVTGFTRHLGLGISYGYFYRSFQKNVTRIDGLPARSDTQSVQVYLTVWAPIFQSGRRANASR